MSDSKASRKPLKRSDLFDTLRSLYPNEAQLRVIEIVEESYRNDDNDSKDSK